VKLFIGIPSAGSPTAPFLESLAALKLPEQITAIGRATVTGNFPPAQREVIVRKALASDADLVLMLDDDMVLPPDALVRLFDTLYATEHAALAGALYYSRDGTRPMVASGWTSADTTTAWIPAFRDDGPVAVDAIGFGCVLIRTTAFAALLRPYFQAQIYIEQHASRVRVCNEDFLFCERLRKAGFSVMLDGSVRCGHFDRQSGVVVPLSWETNDQSDLRRVFIAGPGPAYALVPYDEAIPRSHEDHERVTLDYLYVE